MSTTKMLKTKKSAPVGNASDKEYCTTPEAQSHAQVLFDSIKTGRDHAIARPRDANIDRAFRILVAEANKNGDCIINVGNGYYRPTKGDPLEESELNHYLNADLHRADEIMTRVDSMREAFYGRY